MGSKFLLLPSSVHEFIAFKPINGEWPDVNAMVRDINAAVVGNDDILCDHAYLYDNGQIYPLEAEV